MSAVTHQGGTLNFTSSEAGTYYYLVCAAADTAPDAAAVKAQGMAAAKGAGAVAAGANTSGITGLSAETDYIVYIVAEDAYGNISPVSAFPFSTTVAPIGDTAPSASSVNANAAAPEAGTLLNGSYAYNEGTGTGAGPDASAFRWYRGDTAAWATSYPQAIPGATAKTYTPTGADVGKYLYFEVTPINGAMPGTAVQSPASGQAGIMVSLIVNVNGTTDVAAINGGAEPVKVVSAAAPILSATLGDAGSVAWTVSTGGGMSSDAAAVSPGYALPAMNESVAAPITITAALAAALPAVTGVTVNPSSVTVQKGDSFQFSAKVTGANNPSQAVIWSVNSTDGSAFSTDGLLSVTAGENAETLTVTATSMLDNLRTGTATVTIPQAVTIYTVTVNGSYAVTSGAGRYAKGMIVTIRAGSRDDYVFTGWTAFSNGVAFANWNSAVTTFVMPANAVYVTANWQYNGGGSSSGDGGSSYTPPYTPPGTASGTFTANSVQTIYNRTGGIYASTISDVTLRGIVNDAAKREDGTRVVKLDYDAVSSPASMTNLALTLDASQLTADEDVTFIVETPLGGFIFTTAQMRQWFDGDALSAYTITLTKSSLRVDVKQNGKTAVWNRLTPMGRIGVPYTLKAGEDAANLVVTVSGRRALPTSVYENGIVYANIFALGTYKAAIVTPANFTDTADYAKDAVKAIQQTGVIAGNSGSLFDPKGSTARGEAAAILRRFVELVIDERAARDRYRTTRGNGSI
ncbi:MAG: Ig-like domain-containing protein [Clostridiales bacterium]|nr:Ig-like domain-containing protein [Clostridiales bacterium]